MRLRRVGPGIGGLYYPNLLKSDRGLEPYAVPVLLSAKATAPAAPAGRMHAIWASAAATARRMGRAVVDARMAQAQRLIERETRRLSGRDGNATGRDAIGSRYY
jgi:hypothetical protein